MNGRPPDVSEDPAGIADYEFVRRLGRGANGEFFLATTPERLGLAAEHVVVKVTDGPTAEDAFRRATRELRAFAAVECPQLVDLYDAGQYGRVFFYSMEYLPLGSLATATVPLDRRAVLAAVADAARAAHALHGAGIAHRNVQPATVMLTAEGGKLADLGLAQVLHPGQTVTGLGDVGTIEYIDPAVFGGSGIARSTDIWGLGVTLHRALTGSGIYGDLDERDPLVAIRKVLSASPVLSDGLGEPDRAVIERCIARDPSARYATAAEVAAALDQLARAGTTVGHPSTAATTGVDGR